MRVCFLGNPDVVDSPMLNWLALRKDIDQIFYAKDERRLLKYMEHELPDVTIIHLDQNKIYGYMLGDKIKQLQDSIKLVFISNDRLEAIHAYDVGASGYLMDSSDQRGFNRCLNNIAVKLNKEYQEEKK